MIGFARKRPTQIIILMENPGERPIDRYEVSQICMRFVCSFGNTSLT